MRKRVFITIDIDKNNADSAGLGEFIVTEEDVSMGMNRGMSFEDAVDHYMADLLAHNDNDVETLVFISEKTAPEIMAKLAETYNLLK